MSELRKHAEEQAALFNVGAEDEPTSERSQRDEPHVGD